MTAMIAVTPAQGAPAARAASARVTISRWPGVTGLPTPVPGPYYRPPAAPPGIHRSALAGSAWAIQPTPNVRSANGTLTSESCPSERRCQAVGSYTDLASGAVTLAETWDGKTWRTEATPRQRDALASALSSVACVTEDACIAVGGYIDSSGAQLPLAETWDGEAWKMQRIPNPTGSTSTYLLAVACTSARHCLAVGSIVRPQSAGMLAEEWNGTRWRVVASPKPSNGSGLLSALSCAGTNTCVAVGSSNTTTLAESWNGTSWSLQPAASPNQGFLNGVSCPALDDCHAVGDYLNALGGLVPLAEVWNGLVWTREAAPSPPGAANTSLMAVSCFSTVACTEVGASDGKALAERFDGTTWHLQSAPSPAGGTLAVLDGVSCPHHGGCSAVGSYTNTALFSVTFAERWKGTAWTIQTTSNPTGSAFTSSLQAESCPDATHCEAVGSYVNTMSRGGALAESRTGTSWAVQPIPNPAGSFLSALIGVSCPSVNLCVAVGWSAGPNGLGTLAETWNGQTWTIEPTPTPANSLGTLEAVSCSAIDACTAVGYTNASAQATLAETWNGKTWRIQSTPNPAGSSMDILTGVSCATATACSAVGNDVDATGTQVPLAESWDGMSWTIRSAPVPAGTFAAALLGVSCTAAAACTAVGGHVNQSHIGFTLVESWNGTAWKIQASPSPAGAALSTLTAVWCGSGVCSAVGYTGVITMAESWNGKAWKLQATPNPAGASSSALLGVACSPPTVCTAVGASMNATGVQSTLAEAGGA
jgi:hypothetical protein